MTKSSERIPFVVVAIDGGAASGKSSTARLLAERRNFVHVDTGRHYRALAFMCLRREVPPHAGGDLETAVASLKLDSVQEGRDSRIRINDEVPAETALRSPEVNAAVSAYAAQPVVREAVKAYQREEVERARAAGFAGIVMEGRDIGTVILPQADLKVFLVADPEMRQERRRAEGAKDIIADRDRSDSSRQTAPLRPAGDAVVLDNSSLSLEAVVGRIEELLESRAARMK